MKETHNIDEKRRSTNLFGTLLARVGTVVGPGLVAFIVEDAITDDVMDQVDGAPHVTEHRVAILPRRCAFGMP
jgi:hypothetical protein